jgi:hypothetical protein
MFERDYRHGVEYIFVREVNFQANHSRKERIQFNEASQAAKLFSEAIALNPR